MTWFLPMAISGPEARSHNFLPGHEEAEFLVEEERVEARGLSICLHLL